MRPDRLAACLAVALLGGAEAVATQPSDAAVSAAIQARLADATGPTTARERAQLTSVYVPGAFAPLWLDGAGHPNQDSRDALSLLNNAADEGLEPVDYQAHSLQESADALARAIAQPAEAATFDVALTASTLRYFAHLHRGRIDPRSIGFRMTAPTDDDDFPSLLRSARGEHRLVQAAAQLAPPLAHYRALRGMLSRYRALAADPVLGPPAPSRTAVKAGEPYARAAELFRLLLALGDLAPGALVPEPPSTYGGALVDGVKHFQMRHGLEADGVLGIKTQAALAVPLSSRVRQIELALERLRWLPHLNEDRLLAVNIPMFHLWVWDRIPPNGAPSFGMDVIVGKALNRQTPVFVEEMEYLIFRPYWNIPPSILRGEIIPAIKRDASYLQRQDMEIVAGEGDDAQPVALTPESLAQLQEGRLRVRQRPGARNSLGLVKFVFPNDENVYMHGTPAPQLFRQSRRDFSHGCVRVEDPVGLAEWALRGQGDWTRDSILAAMNADVSRRVNLTRPIQVILFYITAVVMPEDGTVRFADDVYGHDATLDRALAR